jgi:hypothetical protein
MDRTGETNLVTARPFLASSTAFICRGPILLATRSSSDWSSSHEFLANIAAALTAEPLSLNLRIYAAIDKPKKDFDCSPQSASGNAFSE